MPVIVLSKVEKRGRTKTHVLSKGIYQSIFVHNIDGKYYN